MDSESRKAVIKLYEEGLNEGAIASSLNVPESDVRALVERLGGLLKSRPLNKPEKLQVFELKAQGYSEIEIARMLGVSRRPIAEVINKDKSKIKNNSRAIECLELYKNGASLEEIGGKFGITRERVRQITRKQYAYDLGYGPFEQAARKSEIVESYRNIVEGSRLERKSEIVEKRYEEALSKGLEPEYFDSLPKFCEATGISESLLKAIKPDAYEIVLKNARQKARKWSWYYDECQRCGTTTVKHRGYGYCENCYAYSPEFKASQQRSHQKYRDEILAKNKIYSQEYSSRPEVIERLEREYDEKYFGGNRKAALERDNFACLGCKMSIDVRNKSGKPAVRVWHLKGKDDHSLENLGTYCQSCLFKAQGMSRWNRGFGSKS